MVGDGVDDAALAQLGPRAEVDLRTVNRVTIKVRNQTP
jgi:hypothetical protein